MCDLQVCFALMNEDFGQRWHWLVLSSPGWRAVLGVGPGLGRETIASGTIGSSASSYFTRQPGSPQLLASSSNIPRPLWLSGSGLDLRVHFRRQTYNSGHVQCHLEGSSGFPKWKQHALKAIMGREACSGVRPSIYKQRLPFLPGDRTTQQGHNQPQLTPIVS